MHMEYFPSHGISIPYTLVDELAAVLTQARAGESFFDYSGKMEFLPSAALQTIQRRRSAPSPIPPLNVLTS